MENNNIINKSIKQSENETTVNTVEVTTSTDNTKNTINSSKNKIFEAIYTNYIKYKRWIFFTCFVLIIFLLYKYNFLNYSFTVYSNNNNIKDTLYNKNDSNKLICNGDSWNLENEIENIIKRQNIYIQEKKL